MSQIKRRVSRIENQLHATGEPETLEAQMRAFERGKYGKLTMMSVVAGYLHSGEVPKYLPDPLRSWFRETLERKKPERSIQVVQDKKESQSLTEKQIKSTPPIVASSIYEKGCRKARISRNTFYEWLKDPNFKAELQKKRDFIIDEALAVLKSNITKSVDTLVGLLSSTDSDSLKRHICNDIIKYTIKTREFEELESRLTALERIVKERLS